MNQHHPFFVNKPMNKKIRGFNWIKLKEIVIKGS